MRTATSIDQLVGSNLRELRKMRGISMTSLANELGITYQQVQKYEHGRNRISASSLFKIALLFNVKVEDFYIGANKFESGYKMDDSPANASMEYRTLYERYNNIADPKKRDMVLNLLESLSD